MRNLWLHSIGSLALIGSVACSAEVPRGGGAHTVGPRAGDVASSGTGGENSGVGAGVGGSGSGSGMLGTGGGTPGAPPVCADGAPLAPARIWTLTDAQYVNVVRDALGVTLSGADAEITTSVSTTGAFSNYSEAFKIDTAASQGYQRAAHKIALQLQPCGADITSACVEQFMRTKIARAWRRSLSEAEVARLLRVFTDLLPTETPTVALQLTIEAALQSGSFLYRSEIGLTSAQATGPVPLTPEELASALGFVFYDSVPDDTLWAKGVDGSLAQPAVLQAEVERLLTLPQAQTELTQLVGYWAGAEFLPVRPKDATLFPEYTNSVKGSLYASLQAFLNEVIWKGKITDLFASRTVYTTPELSQIYGLPSPSGAGLSAVELPQSYPAAGILTQPGFLAATNKRASREDPIHRGLFINKAFACGGMIPDPPPGALAIAEGMMGTERELAAQRAALPTCGGCHGLFDPFGLTLSQFDPIGRFHATDAAGAPVNTATVIAGHADLDGPVQGVQELASRIAQGPRAANCASQALASFLLGYTRMVAPCDLQRAQAAFASSGSFQDFFRSLLTAPGFLVREPQQN